MAHSAHSPHHPDHETYTGHAAPHHGSSLKVYFAVFAALMVLTVLTVAVARVDLGALNTAVAMAVAILKATVVILWFMHVIHSPRLTWIVVISSFLWLAVLFVLTFSDYLTRHWSIY
ncbi:MAG TPA: cytochrome C oxidase subunit IV family protein [Thermoanaerobaculia bacterium]|nr:cytochrome C oxidase subunit IV family protein [Thermoanaerobaculia bacterium]